MGSLSGKIALVTGGSRGIGKAIAIELANQGAIVLITFKNNQSSAVDVSVENINNNIGGASFHYLNVSDRDSIKQMFAHIKSRYKKLDILVNNAGINKPNDFDKVSDDEWDLIMNTNLKGPFMMVQEALDLLQSNSSIINISSVSGQYGGPRTPHYAASKAGLISLNQVIARFLSEKKLDLM